MIARPPTRPWGQFGGRELAQLNNKKFSIINGSLQPIWPPPRGGFWGGGVSYWKKMKISIQIFHFERFGGQIGQSENFFHFFGKSVEVKICFIFGRHLGAALGAGTCPSKQKEIINDKQFTLWSILSPPGGGLGGGGRGLAQLSNKKFSILMVHFDWLAAREQRNRVV